MKPNVNSTLWQWLQKLPRQELMTKGNLALYRRYFDEVEQICFDDFKPTVEKFKEAHFIFS